MTLPASPNAISLSQVNVELGLSATATISMNDAAVRTLFGKASGAISMSDGHGKSSEWFETISSDQTDMNLATWATAKGWNGSAKATVTVASGVWIYSTSTGTPALTTGSFPNGLTIINNGFIAGKGGNGASAGPTVASQSGGTAISLACNVLINNTNGAAYIGGGGGGGGGWTFGSGATASGGGGGAGGGRGGDALAAAGASTGFGGGAGGSVGQAGATGQNDVGTGGAGGGSGGGGGGFINNGKVVNHVPGGGGGRVFPGTGGAGGASGANGGSGSNAGANSPGGSGGGGGWGAAGGNGYAYTPGAANSNGAAGGKAVALNGYSVTWSSGDTARVYGGVS